MPTATSIIKTWFETGDFPTQGQFWEMLDSMVNKVDGISLAEVQGLVAVLQSKSDVGHTHTAAQISDLSTWATQWLAAQLGVIVAPLVNGLVPAQYIPGQQREVLFYANLAAFPATGVAETIYLARDTKIQYLWDAAGNAYEPIAQPQDVVWVNQGNPSFNLGGFSTTAAATPANGLTFQEFANKLLFQPQPPAISTLTSDVAFIAYKQDNATVNLSFSYTTGANSGGLQRVVVEFSRNNGATYTELANTTTAITTYQHTAIANASNATVRYRITVINNANLQFQRTLDVPYQTYAAPTIAIVLSRSGEREKGDVTTDISGTITRNRANVAITGYQLQYRVNGASWQDVAALQTVSGNPSSVTIPATTHNDAALAIASTNTIDYRIRVTNDGEADAFSNTVQVVFRYRSYVGVSQNAALTSGQVVALGNGVLASNRSRLVTLNSSGSNNYDYYAYPQELGTLTSVVLVGFGSIVNTWVYVATSTSPSVVTVTNSFGVATNYLVYRSFSTGSYSNQQVQFN